MKTYTLYVIALLSVMTVSFITLKPSLEGAITDIDGNGIPAKVQVIRTNDILEANADNNGTYKIEDLIVSNNEVKTETNKTRAVRRQNTLEIYNSINKPITKEILSNLKGSIVAQGNSELVGDEIKTTFDITGHNNSFLIYNNGQQGLKIPPIQNGREVNVSGNNTNQNAMLKSANTNTEQREIRVKISDDHIGDKYQDIDTTINVNVGMTNYLDVIMKKYPEFYANVIATLKNKASVDIENASVSVTPLLGGETITEHSDSDGEAFVNGIPIANYANNKFLPDTLDFLLKVNAESYEEIKDTIRLTAQDFEKTYDLSKKLEAEAYLWRAFAVPGRVRGNKADIEISNEEFEYHRIITDVNENSEWQDTVPVNKNGTTQYKIRYITSVDEGEVELENLEKIVTLTAGQTSSGEDEINEIENKFNLNMKFFAGDTYKDMDKVRAIITSTDKNDTIYNEIITNSELRIEDIIGGFEGYLSLKLLEDDDKYAHLGIENEYFSFKEIPIVTSHEGYASNTGIVLLPETVKTTAEKEQYYNVRFVPTVIEDPKTGELVRVNPQILRLLYGSNSKDAEWLIYGEKNILTNNEDFCDYMTSFTRRNFGIPIKFNYFYSDIDFANSPRIKTLDREKLELIRDDLKSKIIATNDAGLTYKYGSSLIENFPGHTSANIITNNDNPNNYTENEAIIFLREFAGRNLGLSEIDPSFAKMYMNHTTPDDLDTTNNIADRVSVYETWWQMHQMVKEKITGVVNKDLRSNNTFFYMVPTEKFSETVFEHYNQSKPSGQQYFGWDKNNNEGFKISQP